MLLVSSLKRCYLQNRAASVRFMLFGAETMQKQALMLDLGANEINSLGSTPILLLTNYDIALGCAV